VFDTDFVWWIKEIKKIFVVLKQYWLDYNKCSFKQCNFEKNDSLNKELEHIEYYLTKVLNFTVVIKV
jgi:hypothetical protein